jgi:predicted RNA-binding protein with PIN domain
MLDNELLPAVLVASASGCQVAIDLAARHPALVERLVLVGPTMDPDNRTPGRIAGRWARNLSRDSVRRAPGAVHDLIDAGPWRTVRTLNLAFDDPTERKLPRIEAPTLVLRGERDQLAPESWAERIADAIPRAELQTVPAVRRASTASAAPALASQVGAFLSRALPRDEPRNHDEDVADEADQAESPARLIVDGMNVIGSRPDGWWRDRPKAWRELRRDLERYAKENGGDVVLVLDGRRPAAWREDNLVETAFAGGGRDAADDAIVARVEADPHPTSLRVVTSDRGLAERVEGLGAETLPAATFRSRL